MDVRKLSFDDDTFDVAIDKGTMDAMMTAKGDVWVSLCQFPGNMHYHQLLVGPSTASD